MKRKIIISILVIIVIGGIIAYRLYDAKTPDIVSRNPDFVFDIETLLTAIDKDSATTKEKYMDKIIEVKGNVTSIDTAGAIVLGDPVKAFSVVCGLDRRHLKDHQLVRVGSMAVVQGRLTGFEKGEEMLGVSLGTTIQLSFAGVKSIK